MRAGARVRFTIDDTLLKTRLNCTGTINRKWIGKLWQINADPHEGLQDNATVLVHEDRITMETSA